MSATEKRWSVTIEVESTSEDAARLRALLPQFLHDAGYTITSGTRTIEVSFLAATQKLRSEPLSNGSRGQSDWVPVGKRRGLGRGPDG